MDDIMHNVENIFTSSFGTVMHINFWISFKRALSLEHGDHKKARQQLKSPFLHTSHHFSTFRSGMYMGVAIPAFVSAIYCSKGGTLTLYYGH